MSKNATSTDTTAASRSRDALPSDYRRVLEASNLPIEQAVAIADMVELALRSESAPPCRDMAGNRFVQSRATTSPYALAGQKEYPGE